MPRTVSSSHPASSAMRASARPSSLIRRHSVSTSASSGVRMSMRSVWAMRSHSSRNQRCTDDSAASAAGIVAGGQAALDRVEAVPLRLGHRARRARAVVELARAHRLPPRLGERAADAHHLAHRLHLRRQARVGARELLEREPGQLDDDVVERRLERGRRRAGDVVRDLVERVADGELGRDLGDRVARGLGRQRGGARHARVHLDHDQVAALAVQGELDVRAARLDPDRADHVGRRVAQLLVLAIRQRLRRRDRGRVAGVDAHRVDVLDRAHDDDVVVAVADHLELELAPPGHRLLEQHLADRALAQPAGHHRLELVRRAGEAAAVPAERERGPDHQGQPQVAGRERGVGVAHAGDDRARRDAESDLRHRLGEELAILGTADGVVGGADQLHPELVEDARRVQVGREVERGLAAERRQQGIGPLPAQHRRRALDVERLEVGAVGPAAVGHDGRRVRVDQHRAQPLVAQHAQRLAAGVVELARLPDHDRAGADHGDARDVGAPRQRPLGQPVPGA